MLHCSFTVVHAHVHMHCEYTVSSIRYGAQGLFQGGFAIPPPPPPPPGFVYAPLKVCCYVHVFPPLERNPDINLNDAHMHTCNMQTFTHTRLFSLLTYNYTFIHVLLSQSITSLSLPLSFSLLLSPIISFLPPSDKSVISQKKKLYHLLYIHV